MTLVRFLFDLECHLELRGKTHEMKMWILEQKMGYFGPAKNATV